MKYMIDYYAILFFSIFIIFLTFIYFLFYPFYKKILHLLFKIDHKHDYHIFFLSIILLYISVIIILSQCKKFIYDQSLLYYQEYQQRPLYDLFHSMIPYSEYSKYISEIILLFFILILFYLLYKKRDISIFNHFIILLAIIQFVRGILFSITLLPDSSQNCTYSIFLGSCNDLLFSGHIAVVFIILLFTYQYKLFSTQIQKIFVFLFIFMILFILSARNHYSIDVIVALLTTYIIYYFYFTNWYKKITKYF